ncbi:SNF2-related protein, partial [Actinotignum timonense]|uniref:SNF2-related protein n=1 Tax=Actinotignum timonense TaxID=1870995 RepID=UPI00254F7915
IHRVLRGIERNWTFAVSGTPVENSLGDLWSIMALAMPGLLPKWSLFNDKIRRPIENDHDVTALNRLHSLLSPTMMRRTKE